MKPVRVADIYEEAKKIESSYNENGDAEVSAIELSDIYPKFVAVEGMARTREEFLNSVKIFNELGSKKDIKKYLEELEVPNHVSAEKTIDPNSIEGQRMIFRMK